MRKSDANVSLILQKKKKKKWLKEWTYVRVTGIN